MASRLVGDAELLFLMGHILSAAGGHGRDRVGIASFAGKSLLFADLGKRSGHIPANLQS